MTFELATRRRGASTQFPSNSITPGRVCGTRLHVAVLSVEVGGTGISPLEPPSLASDLQLLPSLQYLGGRSESRYSCILPVRSVECK